MNCNLIVRVCVSDLTLLNESSEDIDEPKLSYERILNDLSNVIQTDSITSSCLHSKFFAVGTLYGRIHVFDHLGNKVNRHDLCVHLKPVNCLVNFVGPHSDFWVTTKTKCNAGD